MFNFKATYPSQCLVPAVTKSRNYSMHLPMAGIKGLEDRFAEGGRSGAQLRDMGHRAALFADDVAPGLTRSISIEYNVFPSKESGTHSVLPVDVLRPILLSKKPPKVSLFVLTGMLLPENHYALRLFRGLW